MPPSKTMPHTLLGNLKLNNVLKGVLNTKPNEPKLKA